MMYNRQYLYVLIAQVNAQNISLAVFDSRERCENAVDTELEGWLSEYGLRVKDCGYFVVEEWAVNGPLDKDAVKTLTSYDCYGQLSKRLVPLGMEGISSADKRGTRLGKLLSSKIKT